MKLDLGSIEIKVSRKKDAKAKGLLDYQDFLKVNDDYLNYINGLGEEEIQKRIAQVSVPDLDSPDHIKRANELIKEEGIFIVPNFIDKDVAQNLLDRNDKLFGRIDGLIEEHKDFYEDDELAIQGREMRLASYGALADHGKPVVTVRQGQDLGMIDIFNYDHVNEIKDLNLSDLLHHDGLSAITAGEGDRLSLSNINFYLNRGITRTRGFHADDYNNTIKAFMYVTDVSELAMGPYCYVKGTHKSGAYRTMNSLISKSFVNQTETPLVPVESIIPVIAPKGSLVVSDQSGIHRGLPQGPDNKRALLVFRYK